MRAAAAITPHYERRRPEQTSLYRMVREHYATFAAEVDHASGGTGPPQFVKDEFAAYLDCGILACGFMRLTCEGCVRDTLVAFSCKRRGICTSCGTRRMAETPADLVDHVLPRVPVRQWVAVVPDSAEEPVRRASRTADAGAAHHPPRHQHPSNQTNRHQVRPTIRTRLLKFGVGVLRNTRRVRLMFASHQSLKALFNSTAARLAAASA